MAGANLTTQILKYRILWRPDFNITERWDNANTLPSGHTTMAASAAVALVLLSGRRWRALSAWAGVRGADPVAGEPLGPGCSDAPRRGCMVFNVCDVSGRGWKTG